jgi:hypothetical protein
LPTSVPPSSSPEEEEEKEAETTTKKKKLKRPKSRLREVADAIRTDFVSLYKDGFARAAANPLEICHSGGVFLRSVLFRAYTAHIFTLHDHAVITPAAVTGGRAEVVASETSATLPSSGGSRALVLGAVDDEFYGIPIVGTPAWVQCIAYVGACLVGIVRWITSPSNSSRNMSYLVRQELIDKKDAGLFFVRDGVSVPREFLCDFVLSLSTAMFPSQSAAFRPVLDSALAESLCSGKASDKDLRVATQSLSTTLEAVPIRYFPLVLDTIVANLHYIRTDIIRRISENVILDEDNDRREAEALKNTLSNLLDPAIDTVVKLVTRFDVGKGKIMEKDFEQLCNEAASEIKNLIKLDERTATREEPTGELPQITSSLMEQFILDPSQSYSLTSLPQI